jgi:hypothetical protein
MYLLLLLIFTLKLRFLLSSTGKFYEEKVYSEPTAVTIWRDPIDRLVINVFMKPYKSLIGHSTKNDEPTTKGRDDDEQ